MKYTLSYLQKYRKSSGVSLQDMASIVDMDTGNLSKVENGKGEPSVAVLFAYHIILKTPIEKLFKNHYPDVAKMCLKNAIDLREKLLAEMTSPNISNRLIVIDTVIDRLVEFLESYEK